MTPEPSASAGSLERLKVFTAAAFVAAGLAAATVFYLAPPAVGTPWLIAFAALLALAITGSVLAISLTDGGASTDVSFIPTLAAFMLLGPAGALGITAIDLLATEFLILRKPLHRAVFNLSQNVLSIAIAGLLYVSFGGPSSLTSFDIRTALPPFLVAVIAYFLINNAAVNYAISLVERVSFFEMWRRASGTIIVFDVVMSSAALLVAFFYVRWGPVALLSALVPIVGLRYSYGVNIQLQALNRDLLRVLIKTLEARDEYTSGHSVRVANRSRAIAQSLGLRPKAVRIVETSALLHDIGKIDLAYGEILRQTGPLSAEQRELIRAHPDKGVEIVQSVRSLDPEVLGGIRHHHERWDGDGYPAGLGGDQIPLAARIICLSDSIDAMLTDRPYRAALSLSQVRQEVLRNSGTQFDPVVVEAALAAGVFEDEMLSETAPPQPTNP